MERREVNVKATGEFLAALRKSRGNTQQEIADLLGVTNKTVSKWERGEGLPEISMLPVLAEVYEVTADEILAGRRLERKTAEPKQKTIVAGQWKYCFERAYQKFINFCIVAVALDFIGFLLMEIAKIFLMKVMTDTVVVGVSARGMLLFLLPGLVLLILGFRTFLQKLGEYPNEEEQKRLYSSYLGKTIEKAALSAGILVFFESWNLSWYLTGAYPVKLDMLSMLSFGADPYFGNGMKALPVSEEIFKNLVSGLPLSVVIGSVTGIVVLFFLRKHYQSRMAEEVQMQQQLKKQMAVSLMILCAGMAASGGFKISMDSRIDNGIAEQMEKSDFTHFVNQYFYMYDAFRTASPQKEQWPEHKKGDTEIASEEFDYTIFLNEPYRKYLGVVRFDYENNTVYRRYIGEELLAKRREARNGSALILGISCMIAGAAWLLCRPKLSNPEV